MVMTRNDRHNALISLLLLEVMMMIKIILSLLVVLEVEEEVVGNMARSGISRLQNGAPKKKSRAPTRPACETAELAAAAFKQSLSTKP